MRLKDTGLTAQELKDMVNKYMVETYERYDFIAERAEGMYLYDEEGNAYLDFYGGVAVNSCGNRNPKVIAAIKDQLDDIMHTFNYPYTIPQALLAKKICDTITLDRKDITSLQQNMVSMEELMEQCLQQASRTMQFRWDSNQCFLDSIMQNIITLKISNQR